MALPARARLLFEQTDHPDWEMAPACTGLSNWNCLLEAIYPVRPAWSLRIPPWRVKVRIPSLACRLDTSVQSISITTTAYSFKISLGLGNINDSDLECTGDTALTSWWCTTLWHWACESCACQGENGKSLHDDGVIWYNGSTERRWGKKMNEVSILQTPNNVLLYGRVFGWRLRYRRKTIEDMVRRLEFWSFFFAATSNSIDIDKWCELIKMVDSTTIQMAPNNASNSLLGSYQSLRGSYCSNE